MCVSDDEMMKSDDETAQKMSGALSDSCLHSIRD